MDATKNVWWGYWTFIQYIFMVNVYTYFRGNKTNTKYQLDPPSTKECLNVSDHDRYNGLNTYEHMEIFLDGYKP